VKRTVLSPGSLPTAQSLGWDRTAEQIDPAKLEAAKATFTASGGNLAVVARTHDLAPNVVKRLAAKYDWPVYGDGYTAGEKTRKTRLESLADALEQRMTDMLAALEVETKPSEDFADKGKWSKYVATLSQRSSAFNAIFDRWLRVMTLLEPETFGGDTDPSNHAAAKTRQRAHEDALGGVDGINRQLADFAARVAVGVVDHMGRRDEISGEVIDVSADDD
jgi:hypothetical protein